MAGVVGEINPLPRLRPAIEPADSGSGQPARARGHGVGQPSVLAAHRDSNSRTIFIVRRTIVTTQPEQTTISAIQRMAPAGKNSVSMIESTQAAVMRAMRCC